MDQFALEIRELIRALDQQRLRAAFLDRNSKRPFLDRAAKQRRLQVPFAEHRRRRPKQMRIDDSDSGPARFRIDPLERVVPLVVRDSAHRPLWLLRKPGNEIDRRSDSVADQENRRPGFESADRLGDVAVGEDSDSVEPKPFEGVLQCLRDSFDHHDDRRGAGGRSAAHLIFDERPAGERKQGPKAAAIVLLIGPDQRADRHSPSPVDGYPYPLSCTVKDGKLLIAMTPTPKRAERLPKAPDAAEPIELLTAATDFIEPAFDEEQWREQSAEERGTG